MSVGSGNGGGATFSGSVEAALGAGSVAATAVVFVTVGLVEAAGEAASPLVAAGIVPASCALAGSAATGQLRQAVRPTTATKRMRNITNSQRHKNEPDNSTMKHAERLMGRRNSCC